MAYMNPLLLRFYAKVQITPTCWIWIGLIDKFGYGRHGKILAARLSWELHYGAIPKGMCVLHHCDNPACVRPDHLFLGTQADNMKDMVMKGRQRACRGETNGNSKITPATVIEIRQSTASTHSLAVRFGLSDSYVRKIKTRQRWQHLS